MSQPLLYGEFKFERNVCLNEILNKPDNSDIGYFLKVDLRYPYYIKEKTKSFPFAPVNEKINSDIFSEYMKKNHT